MLQFKKHLGMPLGLLAGLFLTASLLAVSLLAPSLLVVSFVEEPQLHLLPPHHTLFPLPPYLLPPCLLCPL
jgi:hypothetical protein